MRRATVNSDASWNYFMELDADLALLQEVCSIPRWVSDQYDIIFRKAIGKTDRPQKFGTAILVRGKIESEITLSTSFEWANSELERFSGNVVAAKVSIQNGPKLNAVSLYSPAWSIPQERLKEFDVSAVKLKLNPNLWVMDLVWAALKGKMYNEEIWIVGGDLNSSVTFDYMWGSQPRGNQEYLDRMNTIGFTECLLHSQGQLTPTFRNPSNGKLIHQIDHLFVTKQLSSELLICKTGDATQVFDKSMSDHLPIIADFKLS